MRKHSITSLMLAIVIILPLVSIMGPTEPAAAAPALYPDGSPVVGTLD